MEHRYGANGPGFTVGMLGLLCFLPSVSCGEVRRGEIQLALPASDYVDAPQARPMVFGVNRIGDPRVIYSPRSYDEQLYRRVAEAGGTCVRLVASPPQIEAKRGHRDWSEFDHDLDLALKYRQTPIVCIVNTPAWASPTGETTHLYPYKEELWPEFADFCLDLARRTRGKVRYFQLWNEQNGCSWHFHDGFNHADEYLPILKICYESLKKGNPDCVLSMGSLDDAQGHGPIFIRKTYEEMEAQNVKPPVFDVISTHPYSDNSQIMRKKLDAMKELLAAHGDSDKPFWITEYGWHTGHMKLKDQADKLGEVLAAFIQPAWRDVQASIYLCIADYEHRPSGFGLCDVNLRPRPSFHAFQGAERFGAVPPCHIDAAWTADDTLTVTFKTLKPAKASVELRSATKDDGGRLSRTSPTGTDHKVVLKDLEGESRILRVLTQRQVGDKTNGYASAEYLIRGIASGLRNLDFEDGFFGGIAEGWTITGEGFCTDAALIPGASPREGEHAQAVFVRGDKGHTSLSGTLRNNIAAKPGRDVRVTLWWASVSEGTSAESEARIGIDPTGGDDPESSGIQWGEWQKLTPAWTAASHAATGEHSVVTLFVECRSKGDLGEGTVTFMLDDVKVESR